MPILEIQTMLSKDKPGTAVVRLIGSLDTFAVPMLEKKLQELIEAQNIRLIINCQKLRFLSSPGIGLFMGCLGDLEKRGGGIIFAEVAQPEVYDAMKLLGFFEVFPVYGTEQEALQGN